MKCPRCDGSMLDERERQGVVVDVCPTCRGVWLDRGELEKLLASAKRELEEERAYYGQSSEARPREAQPREAQPPREPPPPPRDGYPREGYPRESYRRDSEPPSSRPRGYDRQHGHGQGHYRKKSWLENLGDIFD